MVESDNGPKVINPIEKALNAAAGNPLAHKVRTDCLVKERDLWNSLVIGFQLVYY